jgi:Mrp family chromosome partitioning ATPase
MKELLAEAKERFTVVLLDTPPVLAVIDPVIVSSLADSVVFVVRAGKTTRRPLTRAVEEVRKAKADIIGVVFNEVRIGRQGIGTPFYHYYQYEYEAEGPEGPGAGKAPGPGART